VISFGTAHTGCFTSILVLSSWLAIPHGTSAFVFGTSLTSVSTITIAPSEISGLVELEPRYCDVAIGRWQDYVGQKAVLDGDGRSFHAVSLERMFQIHILHLGV
jgi:hypothetical protein